ncbi:MAG: DUF111 family protein, partial [Cyanobacteria bacterium K_DeepCast_35m_m2_023]|nr:DUF111 family protein [Cyanobacteria bacterium K_DeepCast_35m_m2_023]
RFAQAPELLPRRVGIGLGSRSLDRPNLLRLVLAEEGQPALQTVLQQQAQIDDATAEDLAHLCDALRQAGALEVFSQAITMKKGRLGQLVTVIAVPDRGEALRQVWWQHSTTLGLREQHQQRWELRRRVCALETPLGSVRLKQAQRPDGRWRTKIEHDDLAALAARHGLALADVRAVIEPLLPTGDG